MLKAYFTYPILFLFLNKHWFTFAIFYRYELKVPFVSKGVVDPDKWNLYKLVWPAHLTKNTLALVGFARVNGLIPTLAELQARWVIQVLLASIVPEGFI